MFVAKKQSFLLFFKSRRDDMFSEGGISHAAPPELRKEVFEMDLLQTYRSYGAKTPVTP
jgi:hypothetical protein